MFALAIGLTALVAFLSIKPILAGGAYRFRGKTGLAIEGFGLLGAAVLGFLSWLTAGTIWILVGAAIIGTGMRVLPNSDKRYLE